MSDFDFGGLSSRSFEHLVQAIALAVLGTRVTVFGDGPDGGREATFDGPAPPETDLQWSGYGVVQAKFKQRSGDTKTDANWAVEQLRSELAQFDRPNSRRRIPEYYVYSTNVILTPYPDLGGKDRVHAELENWGRSHGLKDYAVWDYNQLCTFLSVFDGIRRTFAAWTTPGDVLATLARHIDGLAPDFAAIAVQYLQKELRRELYANLQQAGHLNEERISLPQVFVDLPVADASNMEPGQEWVSLSKLPDTGMFIARTLDEASLPLTAKDSIRREVSGISGTKGVRQGRIVLLGGPGQGKTTAGQYLCQLFRARTLSDVDPTMLEGQARDGCKLIMETCSRESLEIAGCRRFPIRVVLSEYAADLARDEGLSLAGYITKLLNSRTEQTLNQRDVLLFLESYPFLLVLDGLDEVPPSSNRTRLIEAINDFEADVAVKGMDAMIIVTTRPQGYSDDLSPRFYRHQVLTPLRPEVALQYGKKLTRLRYGMDPERAARINERLELAAAHEATSRLMQSPLQVTIMTALVDQFGRPPEERWDLFHQYYELICRREIERNIQSSQLIRDHEANINKTHNLYGLLLQSESERTGGTRSRLPLEKFENLVQFILEDEGFTGDRLQEVLTAIRTAAANRLVFLVGLEEGQVGFEIRSLQEFMAGEALLDGSDQTVRLRLEAISGSSNWRNVLLFATGKIFKRIPHLRPHVISICNVLNDNPSDPARQILMSGSQLALDILADGAARKSPLFAAQLTRLALRLLNSPIHATGRSLADVCTQDTLTIYTEELDRLLNSANKATCREAWACLTRLVDLGFAPVGTWFKYIGNRPQLVEDPDFYWMAASAVDANTAVLTELASRLYSMPANSLVMARYGSRKPEVLNMRDPLPQAIEDALDVTSGGDARQVFVRIADWGGPEVGFYSCRPHGKTAGLMLDDRCHASWRVVDAAAAYSSVGTAEALATLVETAKEVEAADPEPPLAHSAVHLNLPWPAVACLSSASLNNSHDALAQALRTGAMGSLEEWQKWEDSWIRDGLNWDSVPARHGVLPFIKDHWLGAPAIAARSFIYSAEVRAAAWQVTESAVSIATQLNDPAGRQAVVSIANLFWLGRETYPEDQKVPLSADSLALARKVFDIVGEATPLSMIHVSEGDASTASVEEFSRLVNDFFVAGTHFDIVNFDDNAIDLFRLAVAKDPSLTGLLTPLAVRAANPDLPFAPFDFATHRKRIPVPLTPRGEFSLLLISVRQGGLRLEGFASVVRLIEQLPRSYLEGFFGALGASASGVDAEAVLVELYRELQRSANGQALMVMVLEELSAMVRSRMTRLSTGDEWERLGLPRRIIEVCH